MKLINKSMLSVVITLSTASVYYAQQVQDTVKTKSNDIEQVVLTGVADIAKDRKTPVAVSTIKEAKIVEKLGNQEFPEILNTTPSVYATKGGGGFGDASIRIRGFGNENIAVMVNGMPVNDMENGAVYWSNWAGMSEVTSAMQVQRGLGSSKLAISSVGGTINILTRAADKKRQGTVSLGLGNDGYLKTSFAYNTGKSAKGWSTSFLMSRTAGAMYIDGSDFEGYNYYFALGYQPNEKHDFQFTFTGAPQWHNQNFTNSIATYLQYGQDGEPNRRYNSNWGTLNGEQFTTNRNYYSKPIASINWDWKISENSKLSTVGYASFGRGGGTGVLGSINGKTIFNLPKTADGQIRFDDIVRWNQGANVADFGANNTFPAGAGINRSNNGITMRSNVNSHDWYGLLSSFNHKINNEFNFSVGIDARYYYGYHPGIITNLLGANGYQERGDFNRPAGYIVNEAYNPVPSANPFVKAIKDKSQIANRNYDGQVLWYGAFGQVEYTKENFTAFIQGAVSNQGFKRIDNWIVDGVTVQNGQTVYRKTDFKNILGYNIKGGANYNINANHNVFANVGYQSKQPFFTAVYPSNKQPLNPNLTNEKIVGLELGYGFRSQAFRANVNLFRTSWADRFQRRTGINIDPDNNPATNNSITNAYAEISGITQVHYGAELEAFYSLNKLLDLEGMFSWGDYRYKGNASGTVFDDNNNPVVVQNGNNTATLALDKAKVGDAPQLTASLGATLKPVKGLRINADWRFVGNLYSNITVTDFMINMNTGELPPAAINGTLKLPDYNLLDVGANYTFDFGSRESLTIGANIYNLLDTTYISEGRSSIYADGTQPTYKGIDVRNQVYFGFGRTWSANITFRF